ncbi:MAG: hypothetical protein WC284_13115 [Candidimonas sp.]
MTGFIYDNETSTITSYDGTPIKLPNVEIGGVQYPVSVGINGQILRSDGTDVIFGDIFSDNIIYVAKNGNDVDGNGSQTRPFLTISAAMSSASSDTTIIIAPGIYVENVTFSNNNITLFGLSEQYSGSLTSINGTVDFTGTGNNAIENIKIIAQGSNSSFIDNGSDGDHLFVNVVFDDSSTTSVDNIVINNGQRNYIFRNCHVSGDINFNNIGPNPLFVSFYGGQLGKIKQNNSLQSITLYGVGEMGPFEHNGGILEIDQCGKIKSESSISIVSTSDELLRLSNVELLGSIEKTGNGDYIIHNCQRDNSFDVLNGNRIYINEDDDIGIAYQPSNYVGGDNLADHLYGIDQAIGDTTPELNGDLDVNGYAIVSSSGGDIVVQPDGQLILDNLIWPTSDGLANQAIVTDGNGNLSWSTRMVDLVDDITPTLGGDLDVNGYTIVSSSGTDIIIDPDGQLILDNLIWPTSDGSDGQVLVTDGNGNLSWSTRLITIAEDTTPTLGGDLDVNGYAIVSSSGSDIVIYPDGQLVLDSLIWPTTDGSDGQVLVTDGMGQLSWSTRMTQLSDDSAPLLGGSLDLNGNAIISVGTDDIVISPLGSGQIILNGLVWPENDGLSGYLLATDGSGNLVWETNSSPQNVIYVSENGSDINGMGTILNPYQTIQNAINVSSPYDTIMVYGGVYAENLTINVSNLSIFGQGIVQINGNIAVNETCVIDNIIFSNSTTILDINAGKTEIKNSQILRNSISDEAIIINGNIGGNITISNTEIIGTLRNLSTDINQYYLKLNNIIGENCSISNESINAITYIENCTSIGHITHNAGIISVNNVGYIRENGGLSITSTANGLTDRLYLTNTSTQQPNGNYGIINKTGICNYAIGDINRDIDNDILGGNRLNYTRFAVDENVRFSPSSYTITGSSVENHLTAIDDRFNFTIYEINEDSTPSLGGDLDVNGYAIVSSSGSDIVVNSDGRIILNGFIWPETDGYTSDVLKTDGNGDLYFDTLTVSDITDIGTLADQDSDNVDITGGTINGTDIGTSTPANAQFVNLTTNGLVNLNGLSYPSMDGNANQIIITDGNGTISFADIGLNILYVSDSQGDDIDGNGSLNRPFETIQTAINASNNGDYIRIMPGLYIEDLQIDGLDNIVIEGYGVSYNNLVEIQGSVLIENGSTQIYFKNLNISGNSIDVPITINSTDGYLSFENIFVGGNSTAVDFVGSNQNWIDFIDCSIDGIVDISGTPLSGSMVRIIGNNSYATDINVSHINWKVIIEDCHRLGIINHADGHLILNNIKDILSDGGTAITSTANNLSDNFISIQNVNFRDENGNYGIINKTGNCDYLIAYCNRDVLNDNLNGNRIYGQNSIDIEVSFNPTNYTPSTNDIDGHLSGIDAALGNGFGLITDTSPQLGGNLDVNGFEITSTSSGDVVINPDGLTIIGDMYVENISTETILNNQPIPVTFYTTDASFTAIYVDYVVIRDDDRKIGTLMITNNGSTSSLVDFGGDIGMSGVSFGTMISGPNVVLYYTSSNTGINGTIRFGVRKWTL